MSRNDEAKEMAKEAMRQVIYMTADLNSRALISSFEVTEEAGQAIVEGAIEGLVFWLLDACPKDMDQAAFFELSLTAVRHSFATHQMMAAPAAGSA